MSSSDSSIYKIEHLRGSKNYSVWKSRKTAYKAWTTLSDMYKSKGDIDTDVVKHICIMHELQGELERLGRKVEDDECHHKARTTLTNLSTALPATDKSTATCYNYGKIGHFSAQCRKLCRNNDNADRQQYSSHANHGSRNHKLKCPTGGKLRTNIATDKACNKTSMKTTIQEKWRLVWERVPTSGQQAALLKAGSQYDY
ncbi:hypothetical protein C8R45DRAFT_928483 [Mycena sanguinolenta]|nr:hypothetical protein C8R45DRAFT_928483 [Mycena sanguinolenta]